MATRTTQPPPVSTKISINGREFELRNMSAAQGDTLYAALGQLPGEEGVRYRQMADSVAHVAQQFNALANIELPPGLTLQDALLRYFSLLGQGKRAIESATDPWIKHMHQALSPGTARSLDFWARGASVPGNILDGARDGLTALPQSVLNAIGALRNRMPRGVNISEDQARAFGAAYAAAMYREQNPDPAAQTQTPAASEPGIMDKLTTGLEYGWMRLTHAVPLIPRVMRTVTNWFGAIPDSWSISAAWRKAGQDLETAQRAELAAYGGRMPSFSELLANNHRISTETPRHADAQATLRAAGTVAGISTEPLVRALALEGNAPFWNREGHLASIRRNSVGLPEAQPVNRPDGTPVTHENSAQTRTYGLPESGRDWEYHVSYVAGGAMTGQALRGVAEGVARLITGKSLAPLNASNSIGTIWNAPRAAGRGVVHAAERGAGIVRDSAAGLTKGAVSVATGVVAGGLQGLANLVPGGQAAAIDRADRALSTAERTLAASQAEYWAAHRRTIGRMDRIDELTRLAETERSWNPFASRPYTRELNALKADEAADIRIRQRFAQPVIDAQKAAVDSATAARNGLLTTAQNLAENGGVISRTAVNAASNLRAAAEAVENAGTVTREVIQRGAEFVGAAAAPSGANAARSSGLFRTARYFGRGIPLVGAGFTSYAIFGSSRAHAEEGDTRSYWTALNDDRAAGRVSEKEFAAYRTLQTAFAASGIGGFVTAGVTEAVQNLLENGVSPEKLPQYLPPSLVSTVRELIQGPATSAPTPPPTRDVGAQSGSAGAPDAGLTAAAVDAHTRAQREAGVVIMEARTALGAVIPGNGDTTPPTRPAALPIPPVAERGMSATA